VALTTARQLGLAEQWKDIERPFAYAKGRTRPRPTLKRATDVRQVRYKREPSSGWRAVAPLMAEEKYKENAS
jgi:hypothetical protein